jgi:hypothetical protein
MYTSCIFCHESLGTNEHIVHFPIGRRLAFDSAKGRLWVVCRSCAQWNLAPLEERWEAVEDCERAYRTVRTRVSTSEIGLSRLRDGFELIRIGAPLRPEFAAWRFGDQFGARQRRLLLRGAGGVGLILGAGITITGTVALPLIGPAVMGAGLIAAGAGAKPRAAYSYRRPISLTPDEGDPVLLGRQETLGIEMRADNVPHGFRLTMDVSHVEDGPFGSRNQTIRHVTFSGPESLRAARLLLPRINGSGATRRTVRDAVDVMEEVGRVERVIPDVLARTRKAGFGYSPVHAYPQPIRLAIEMALHEEAERRAMEGELAELEAAWREADTIAGIADDLLLPDHVNVFLQKHRKG